MALRHLKMNKTIGIDLGTTFCAIGHINNEGEPEVIPNKEGDKLTPSAVWCSKEGNVVVGKLAKENIVFHPNDVCLYVKKQMGGGDWEFNDSFGTTYKPEQISAFILKRLRDDASEFFGEDVRDVVITVPAYFDDAARASTMDAGRIAGLNVLRIINEPTAAALAYSFKNATDVPETVLVFDLGGGTFDVTVLNMSRDKIEVLATNGDRNLGGFDWDNALMENFVEQIREQNPAISNDVLDSMQTLAILRNAAESVKKILTQKENVDTTITLENVEYQISVTRDKFEAITEKLVLRTKMLTEVALDEAGVDIKDLKKVILVGGSTRMTMIPKMLKDLTCKKPIQNLHPDEVVALGAAILAENLNIKECINRGKSFGDVIKERTNEVFEKQIQEDDDISVEESAKIKKRLEERMGHIQRFVVEDVCSHSLGVLALDLQNKETNCIILKKDSKLPASGQDTFVTTEQNQTSFILKVTEGEDANPEYVKLIGQSKIALDSLPKEYPIIIEFCYNQDGMFCAKVYDGKDAGFIGDMEIDRRANLTEKQKLAAMANMPKIK